MRPLRLAFASVVLAALAGCAGAPECGDRCHAERRYAAACDSGDAQACFDLARAMIVGGNTSAEPDAAARHERACELGLTEACEHGEKSYCDLTRLFTTPPGGPGQRVILGQLARDPDLGIAVFHAADELPSVGTQGKLYSAVGGERLSAWTAVAAGEITSAEPGEIRMVDTSDYRLKINFCEGCFVALVWDGGEPAEYEKRRDLN